MGQSSVGKEREASGSSERKSPKRGHSPAVAGAGKKRRVVTNWDESEEEMEREVKKFKVIVRVSQEKGLQVINPVKLSTI